MTPGQAAYEAYVRAVGLDPADWPFEACAGDTGREGWEDVAKAGYEAIAAQEPKAAPELLSVTQERHPGREVNLITADERDYEPDSADIPSGCEDAEPKAAPELAAAMREARGYRDALERAQRHLKDAALDSQRRVRLALEAVTNGLVGK